ncbi:MAG: hypothetical protein KDC98_23935 [Planctomycetes bacterium]|nr:hypothetical protein [Planctomycetota bacterium]
MSESKQPFPIDPKEAAPAGFGFVIGLLILVGFYLLATAMGLPTFVERWNIPGQ